MVKRNGQRILFADVSPCFINHRQSICIRILTENGIGAEFHSLRGGALEICLGRFRWMLKQSIGSIAKTNGFAAQGFQQAFSNDAASTVVAVQDDFELLRFDRRNIDRFEDEVDMIRVGVF